jgi:hypothetical protein
MASGQFEDCGDFAGLLDAPRHCARFVMNRVRSLDLRVVVCALARGSKLPEAAL